MKGKLAAGKALQVLGLLILPAAFVYGVQGGDLYQELVLFAMGIALLMMGRSLTGGGGARG